MNPTRRRVAVALTAGALTLGMATVAVAQTAVTQSVTAGSRTASVAAPTLAAVAYSHGSQSTTGTMVLSADDSTGSGDGWNVTVQSSKFVHTGGDGTTDIAATNFAVTTAAAPTASAGQAVDGTGGPKAGDVGTLETARKVISATAGFGQGDYRQNLGVSLTIPPQTRAGTYTGTVTTTITVGPTPPVA